MEYLISFVLATIGGILGSMLIIFLTSPKKIVNHISPQIKEFEPSEFQKKTSIELDEMLNKNKQD